MDLYQKTSRWKIYLFLVGIIILLIPWLFANYLAKKLQEGEQKKMQIYARTMEELTRNTDNQADFTFHQQILASLKDIPILAVSETGRVVDVINCNFSGDTVSLLKEFKSTGIPPIESFGYARYIYYKHPQTMQLLNYFPWFQLILLVAYALIGYAVFNTSRREEQNRVWVGMAKETAHQLGTPISGIMGWIENLRMSDDITPEEREEILKELQKDSFKLQQVADRFSKIGSKPELTASSLREQLLMCKEYMQARSPKTIEYEFFAHSDCDPQVMINSNLFQWVVENILRNSLDAMDGKGKISVDCIDEKTHIDILIKDTGHGIPSSKHNAIFRPGFTTKQRGWGLGLSLAKRIIENYHKGKIFVKESKIGEGTTFCIQLPVYQA
ncbi:MAG: HAMP domain-containing histidine kinase [Saprospiraceae bacterium]|jgi:hypothetical protein|nr:HAMP domain-containing histidine kinase [Saprospiraceae bacterium]